MTEIIYRIPSKVPYGYVEVRFNEGDIPPDPLVIAEEYANYFYAYKGAEEAALTKAPQITSKPAITKPLAEVTTLTEDEAKDLIVRELGGVPIEGGETEPWKNKPDTVDEPWVEEKRAPVTAASSDWDFS